MKKTARITLVLVGSISATACDSGPAQMRNQYRSFADCAADYSEATCRQENPGAYSPGYLYRGPSYYHSSTGFRDANDPGPGRANKAVGTETVKRGGFGSSAARHGGSSSS